MSEKKELKQEELKKVSGGGKDGRDSALIVDGLGNPSCPSPDLNTLCKIEGIIRDVDLVKNTIETGDKGDK